MDFAMTINDYFSRVVVINLRRREDRWRESVAELASNGIKAERFEAYDHPTSGHAGCTRSHRMLLREIAEGPHERVLILEDDFAAVTRARLVFAGFKRDNPVWVEHCKILNGFGNLNERFEAMVPFLPEKWDCLFLGMGYAEAPISRFNQHVVRCTGVKGTGSLGVTREFAKVFTERADAETDGDLNKHVGCCDDFYSKFSRTHEFYCLQPRLIYQRDSFSDITGQKTSYLFLGTDVLHEKMV